ncbi:DNA topology modulation protein FlaR [Alkalihalobacillus sp. AL-G]|uniref:AAA family ATPase n=1 Tax=Alkalihalobacillus sp. AL-G TaxID=2926399 RepID=UPI00272A22B1|nr:DNA topology modulation protein FlaR [Alkalihalobacillus sp. AL-G]WLD94749.1 DNA topology modulation protein FlaR [Alkalihalobacillus sp. AL-G]
MQQLYKIHIIGSVGSGKSTLGRILSNELHIPHYELDNIVWRRGPDGDIRNTPEQRDEQLHQIVQSDKWIVEGVHHEWVTSSFERADLIVFVDIPVWKRNIRILKRFIKQRLKIEKANYKPTLHMLMKMYKWNYQYECDHKPEIFTKLHRHNNKLKLVRQNDLNAIIEGEFYEQRAIKKL